MKQIFFLIAALTLVGCTYPQKPMPDLDRNISVIKLKLVEDVHASCNQGAGTNYPRVVARYQSCAKWTSNKTLKSTGREYNSCEITLGKSVNMEVLGHEVLHCFVGNFHGEDKPRNELATR